MSKLLKLEIPNDWRDLLSLFHKHKVRYLVIGGVAVNRFEEDFDRAEMMGMTSYRLGIEWARLQPEGPRQELVPAARARSFRYARMDSLPRV